MPYQKSVSVENAEKRVKMCLERLKAAREALRLAQLADKERHKKLLKSTKGKKVVQLKPKTKKEKKD